MTGIVILAKQRKRGGATPWLVAAFSALVAAGCLGLIAGRTGGLPGFNTITLPVALVALVLAALVILKEKTRR